MVEGAKETATHGNAAADIFKQFEAECEPLESGKGLLTLVDRKTNANYCECHIKASILSRLATVDVPLDPTNQSQYRANRELTDDPAFKRMQEDATKGRSFSNIVAQYTKDSDASHPLKIINTESGQSLTRSPKRLMNTTALKFMSDWTWINC